MIRFQITQHARRPGRTVIEILDDGACIGTIYPDMPQGRGIAIFSKYLPMGAATLYFSAAPQISQEKLARWMDAFLKHPGAK